MILESEILYVPGILIKNPTVNMPPAYGGTIVGSGKRFRVFTGLTYYKEFAEEMGRWANIYQTYGNPWAHFELRQWSQNGLDFIFPTALTKGFQVTGGVGIGTKLATNSYLWAADRATDPSVLITDAVVLVNDDEEETLRFSLEKELKVWVSLMSVGNSGSELKVERTSVLFP